jgi:hypothetical protein
MQPAIAAFVLIVLCLAGAFAALSARRTRTEEGGRSRPPWWQVAALCSVAVGVAVVVLSVYLRG